MSPSDNASKNPPPVTHEVQYKDKTYEKVREGLADILNFPSGDSKKNGNKQAVFYNPIQQFNRDLSVLAIRAFAEDLAVIRRARHERRIEKLARDGKRGTKRKREQVARHDTVEKSNGNKKLGGQATLEGSEDSTMPHFAENIEQLQGQEGVPPTISNTTLTSDPLAGEVGLTTGNSSHPNGHTEGQQSADGVAADAQHEDRAHHDVEQNGAPTIKTPQFRILDALSATGLRALRYVKEIPQVTSVTANDISPSATASIKLNAEYNGIIDKIQPTTGDAKSL
ncbi:MAG: hypothetical protein Q9180_008531, partial [Flavoplaca navasiana]